VAFSGKRWKSFVDGFVSVFDPSGKYLKGQPLIEREPLFDDYYLARQQGEMDKRQNEAIMRLLEALKDMPNAVIQAGTILVVKASGEAYVRILTLDEIDLFHKNPALMSRPDEILEHFNVTRLLDVVRGIVDASEVPDVESLEQAIVFAGGGTHGRA
jgi:hypothetical protein